MKRKPQGYWTRERIIASTKKFQFRYQWRKDPSYDAARNHGLINDKEVSGHLLNTTESYTNLWTAKNDLRLKKLFSEGYTDIEISVLMNLTRSTLNHRIDKLKIRHIKKKPRNKIIMLTKKIDRIKIENIKKEYYVTGLKTHKKRIKNFDMGERASYWKFRITHMKQTSRHRNIKFTITRDDLEQQWLKQKGLCYYTDIPLRAFDKGMGKKTLLNRLAVDRKNNNFGYIKNNIVFSSEKINIMKHNLSFKEFIKWCSVIARKHN